MGVMLERLHRGDGMRVAPCSKQDLSKEWVMEKQFQAREFRAVVETHRHRKWLGM